MNDDAARFLGLPEELLNEILSYLSPHDLAACQQTCTTLDRLSSDSLGWRRHCLTEYKYWGRAHDIDALVAAPPISVKWKDLLAARRLGDQLVAKELDVVLKSQVARSENIHGIVRRLYDAKDELERSVNVDEAAEDALSRKYWCLQTLGSIERHEALQIWYKVARGENVPLEKALGAFDLFIAERPPETLDQISLHLDLLVARFKDSNVHEKFLDCKAASKKASIISKWMFSQGLISTPTQDRFRNLRNTLIGVALCEHVHEALPIISVAIFCCICQRLGVDAHPCGYPGKVIAVILPPSPPPGQLPDGKSYFDPSGSPEQLDVVVLHKQLETWGIPERQHRTYLDPASIKSMIFRVARNLEESVTIVQQPERVLTFVEPIAHQVTGRSALRTLLHPPRAKYAVHWANLLFFEKDADPTNASDILLFHNNTDRLSAVVIDGFPMDYGLMVDFPRELTLDESCHAHITGNGRFISDVDRPMRSQHRRNADMNPMHKVGQVFKHKRYNYLAAITGWDVQCNAGNRWIQQMGVDTLPRGREQPFYHIIDGEFGTSRYVAEENIELLKPEEFSGMPQALIHIAGKWFKRWDQKEGVFVSNITEEYPDD